MTRLGIASVVTTWLAGLSWMLAGWLKLAGLALGTVSKTALADWPIAAVIAVAVVEAAFGVAMIVRRSSRLFQAGIITLFFMGAAFPLVTPDIAESCGCAGGMVPAIESATPWPHIVFLIGLHALALALSPRARSAPSARGRSRRAHTGPWSPGTA